MSAPKPLQPPPGATLPSVPLTGAHVYRNAAHTNVAGTLAAERKRIGALSGEQVRAERKARAKAARDAAAGARQQPLELVTNTVALNPSARTRKATR